MRIVKHRGKWAVRYRGKRFSTGLEAIPENYKSAERSADQIVQKIAADLAGDTCREIVSAYLADMPNRSRPRIVSPQLQNVADKVVEYFGDLEPREITRDLCRAYLNRNRKAGLSRS